MRVSGVTRVATSLRRWRPIGWASVARRRPFRIRQAQPAVTESGFENAVFLKKIGDNLLLVPLEPASDHGDQDFENHSRSSGWRS
jgi:hypothetical protein